MKATTRYLAAIAAAFVMTSCGTTAPPKAIPVYEPGSIGDIIEGLENTRNLIREGSNVLQEFQRFRRF